VFRKPTAQLSQLTESKQKAALFSLGSFLSDLY